MPHALGSEELRKAVDRAVTATLEQRHVGAKSKKDEYDDIDDLLRSSEDEDDQRVV